MKLPYINPIRMQRKQIGTFMGLDRRIITQENAFADMENISLEDYPVMGVRKPRGEIIKTLSKPNGLFWKNGLAYVDGTSFYYKDAKKGDVSNTEKNMVGMGAYILIFPDKKYFNTHTGEFGTMEKTWTQGAQATFTPTYAASVYTKISCTGIGKNFNEKDGVTISGCTNAAFNGTFIIEGKTNDSITVISTLEKQFTQASGLKLTRTIPDMDFIVENENRLWGCSNAKHEVYASKLGDPMNFNVFEGISTDSYAATIGSDGNFTGAASSQGYVVFFKEDKIHKVQGNKPSNIQITSQEAMGVKEGCADSLCSINGTLYYVAPEGVCAYTGGVPYLISELLGNKVSSGMAGTFKGNYYLFAGEILVYSPERRIWTREESMDVKFLAGGEGELYIIDSENRLFTLEGNRTEKIFWYLESGDQEEGSLQKKFIQKLQFYLELEQGSQADILIQYDNSPMWEHLYSVTAKEKRVYTVPVIPRRCSRYRYRIEGMGRAKLLGIGKYTREGSEI